MSKQGRVLVVDDLEQWREELVETLQRGGFYVDSASTSAAALEYLKETFYHVLILDIRMDEADPSNIDGLDLLRELEKRGLSKAIKVVMLSAHDTKEQIRTAFKEFGVADFLSKDKFNNREFLENVCQIFAEQVKINLALRFHWQKVDGPEKVVLNLEIDGARIRRNPSLQSRIAFELEDLLCRLFYDAESIMVGPLALGQTNTGVLRVQPFYPSGGGRTIVVKFGDFRKIEEEYANFKKYVQPFIGGGRNTTVLSVRRTPRLGGIIYSLLGADEHLEHFGNFYLNADVVQIRSVLDRLFLDTCGAWYANLGQLQPYNLTADYQQIFDFTSEKIEHAINELQKYVQLKTVQSKRMLEFKSLNGERVFTDPMSVLDEPDLVLSTYICTTHGDFNQYNILVDSDRNMWLIDFFRTGRGHVFRDVSELDSIVRFSLLAPEDATLEERLKMEEELGRAERFGQVPRLATNLPTDNQALAKAFATVVHLRTLAKRLVAQKSDDMGEYYIALFYNALNTLRFYWLPSAQRAHALLSASLLADKLRLRG